MFAKCSLKTKKTQKVKSSQVAAYIEQQLSPEESNTDSLTTLTKEENALKYIPFVVKKNIETQCIQKKSKLYSHVYEVYISLVLDIYIYIYIYMEIYIQFNKFELRVTMGFSERRKSRVSLLLHFHIASEDGSNLSLHEGPGDIGAHQRTFLPTRAIDLSASALLFNALSGARETELVRRDRRALHKVGILQPLVAEGAAQGGTGCQRGVWEAGRVHRLQSSSAAGGLAPHFSGAKPSLVHRGGRGRAAAVPPGGGVNLGGIFRGVTAPGIVCY